MKTLIIYASKHGSAEKAANILYQKLEQEKEIVNIRENSKPFIDNFDTIILGGSIYGGKIQKEIQQFVKDNLEKLLKKKIGIYLCCGLKDDFEKQLNESLPSELINHAELKSYFGHEYNKDKMNFFEKAMVKIVAHGKGSESELLEDKIVEFAKNIQGEGNG